MGNTLYSVSFSTHSTCMQYIWVKVGKMEPMLGSRTGEEFTCAGLKITAGHRIMSGQDDYLSGQNLGLAVILAGQVRGFQMIN